MRGCGIVVGGRGELRMLVPGGWLFELDGDSALVEEGTLRVLGEECSYDVPHLRRDTGFGLPRDLPAK